MWTLPSYRIELALHSDTEDTPLGGDKARYSLTDSPNQSLWLECFSRGCLGRMGQEVHQDWAIPPGSDAHLTGYTRTRMEQKQQPDAWSLIASLGAYSVIALCGSFRGSEVFLVDLHGLRKYLAQLSGLNKNYVIAPLLGRCWLYSQGFCKVAAGRGDQQVILWGFFWPWVFVFSQVIYTPATRRPYKYGLTPTMG